jgi:beta-carotene hydroxylase
MQLRFREDYRTLVWALVLFPAVPWAGIVRPGMTPWLLPVTLYLAYCAGVLTHNHNHCPVFFGRRSNAAYGAWLSVFYGLPTFTWIPTHNQNHHRYLNSVEDVTHTWRYGRKNTLLNALLYPLWSSRWQLPLVARFIRNALGNPRLLWPMLFQCCVLVVAHASYVAAAVALHGPRAGLVTYAFAFGIPALLAPYFMMFTNYVQHVDCSPTSQDDHSRNFVSPWMNWLVFDAGYHTVHHEHAGTHWSRYRALHRAREHQIDPALNQHSILSYCVRTYILRCSGRRNGQRQMATPVIAMGSSATK